MTWGNARRIGKIISRFIHLVKNFPRSIVLCYVPVAACYYIHTHSLTLTHTLLLDGRIVDLFSIPFVTLAVCACGHFAARRKTSLFANTSTTTPGGRMANVVLSI